MDFITREDKAQLEQTLRDCVAARKELSARIATARELGDLKDTVDGITSSVLGGLDSAKESATKVVEKVKAIKDKLVVILDQLKARGVDVSKYLSALKGK